MPPFCSPLQCAIAQWDDSTALDRLQKIVYKKGIKLDGSNPWRLTGYGAYGYSFYRPYQHQDYAWYEKGGVMPFAHVRGGGEKGEQ